MKNGLISPHPGPSPGPHIARYWGSLYCEHLLRLERFLSESPSPMVSGSSWSKEGGAWDLEGRNEAASMILWRSLWLDVVTVGNRNVSGLQQPLLCLWAASRNSSQLLTLWTNSGLQRTSRHSVADPQRRQLHKLSHHDPCQLRCA